jgi:ribosomal protein S6--L-glutamate ligase
MGNYSIWVVENYTPICLYSKEHIIAGVDMLQSKRGPLIMEVNSSLGLGRIEKVTNIDIADKIIGFVEKNVHNWEMIQDRIKV